MIQIAEIFNDHKRYRLSSLGREVMNEIGDGFGRCLYEWYNKYEISA